MLLCRLTLGGASILTVSEGLGSALAQQEAQPNIPPSGPEVQGVRDEARDALADAAHAESLAADPAAEADPFGDELLLFEDLPMVISASRQARPINLSPTPISVITADDVHFSGLVDINDLLQFEPGVDVLRIDRNRFAIGVRGLHDPISDRTLSMINGRNASNPLSGTMDFSRLPLFTEDVDRIEIVRGPGGAVWGANAFNGVINVITKKPEDLSGVLVSSTINEYGDTDSHLRWAQTVEDWSWRASMGYRNHVSSDEAIDRDDFLSRDFGRMGTFDGEAAYRISDSSRLRFGLGYADAERGDFELVGFFPMKDEQLHTGRAFAKLETELESGGSAYVQWFGNYFDSEQPSLSSNTVWENDLEAQISFDPAPEHNLTVGGNVRWVNIDAEANADPEVFRYAGEPLNEFWGGLFLTDSWRVADRFTVESQIRADHYSEISTDWSGRLAGLYALDEEDKHVVRVAIAKAFRAPLTSFRRIDATRTVVAPGLFAVNVQPNDELENEQTWSLESGYTGRFTDHVVLRTDAYYQRYEDLIGIRTLPDPLGLGRFFGRFDNLDGADAYGVETEVAFEFEPGELALWYAYNDFAPDVVNQDIRTFLPAKHKTGVSGRLRLPHAWTANANYRFTDTTRGNPLGGTDVPSFHRLDLSIAKSLADGRGELMLGVTDLFDTTDLAIFSLGNFTAHETPGRTVFARVQIKF